MALKDGQTTTTAEGVSGVPGLSIWNGLLQEEYLLQLKGTRRHKVFREMRDDAVIGTLEDAVRMPLLAASFSVTPGGDADIDNEAAEFFKSVMNDMNKYTWRQHTLDMLDIIVEGFALSEIVFKKRTGSDADPGSNFDDGLIGIKILDPRAQSTIYRWGMDDNFDIEYVVQQDPNSARYLTIEAWKLLHATFRSRKRNPEGTPTLRSLYRAWYTRKNLEVLEAIGAERDLAGLPVLHLPSGATTEDKTAAEKLVRGIRLDEEAGLVLPAPPSGAEHGWKFELVGSPGQKQFKTREIIRDLNKIILMRFFAQFLMLGMDKVGTQALVEGSQDFFSLALESIQKELTEMWNQQLVPLVFKLNAEHFSEITALPELIWTPPGSKDALGMATVAKTMIEANVLTPEEGLEDFMRAAAGFPDRPEGVGEGPRGTSPMLPPGGFKLTEYDWFTTPAGDLIVQAKKAKKGVGTGLAQPDTGDVHIPTTKQRKKFACPDCAAEVVALEAPTCLECDSEMEFVENVEGENSHPFGSKVQYVGEWTCMVAIPVNTKLAKHIAIAGGEKPSILHVTLSFHGDVTDAEFKEILKATNEACGNQQPFKIKLMEPGIFDNGEDRAFHVKVGSEELLEFRAKLVASFKSAGVDFSEEYEYQPHLTLKYLASDEQMPNVDEGQEMQVAGVGAFVGDQRVLIPFRDEFAEVKGTTGRRERGAVEKATNDYQGELLKTFDKWAKTAIKKIGAAERSGKTGEALNSAIAKETKELSKELKETGRKGLTQAVSMGMNGAEPSPEMLRTIADLVEKNEKFIDESLIPRLHKRIFDQIEAEMTEEKYQIDDVVLGLIFEGLRNEMVPYSGPFYNAVFIGAGLIREQEDKAIKTLWDGWQRTPELEKKFLTVTKTSTSLTIEYAVPRAKPDIGKVRSIISATVSKDKKLVKITTIDVSREVRRRGLGSSLVKTLAEKTPKGYKITTSGVLSQDGRALFNGLADKGLADKVGDNFLVNRPKGDMADGNPRKVRWILDPAAEHCQDSAHGFGCIGLEGEYASWDALPTVPAGEVTCLGNCRCNIEAQNDDGSWERVT